MDEETIKSDIENYIAKNGGVYSTWYVGIAQNAPDRLFKDRNVKENGGAWIWRPAASRTIAERIEKYLIETHGTQGNPGGGSDATTSVYAYRIENYTKE